MPDFEYKPISLEGHAFRLLRLLQGKGNSDPIQCQLFESNLTLPERTTASPEHIHDYAAVSYTWGNNSRPCDITVNGSNMAVTKNAYLALQDLRDEDQDQFLWIDALCINQNNNNERGHQVQQMGSIYSQAKRVIIWLGEAAFDTNYVMDYMKQLEKQSLKYVSDGQELSRQQWIDIWSEIVRDFRRDQRDLLVEGFQSLLHRSWFKRVWIIQEAANAQVAQIVCGGKSVSAGIFALMPTLLGITPEPHCQPIFDIMPGSHRNSSWWAEEPDLHTVLDKFRNSEATDPRDKIYALLGISSNAYDTDVLRADYGKNPEDTVFDTVSFLLKLNDLEPPIRRFFDWTVHDFFGNLDVLANNVLKCAMDAGHAAVVKLLLETGKADINSRDYKSQILLLWAVRNGHAGVVEVLLTRGAQIESRDRFDQTPLLWAASNGHKAVVELLLERGAQIESRDRDFGQTPLLWAGSKGHKEVVELLLERGAQIESMNNFGQTPLSWAASNGHKAVVELLLERGAQIESGNNYSQTPLSWAASNGHKAVIELLLERGAQIESRDKLDQTPLSWAASNGHKAVIELLLERGAQIESRDWNFGQTPLLCAASNGNKAVVELLLERGAQIESMDMAGSTALVLAVKNGHKAVVDLLLDKGAKKPDKL